MKRHIALGFEPAATATCAGVVLGLYRCRGKNCDHVLGWAEDFPAETASHAVATLGARERREASALLAAARRDRRSGSGVGRHDRPRVGTAVTRFTKALTEHGGLCEPAVYGGTAAEPDGSSPRDPSTGAKGSALLRLARRVIFAAQPRAGAEAARSEENDDDRTP